MNNYRTAHWISGVLICHPLFCELKKPISHFRLERSTFRGYINLFHHTEAKTSKEVGKVLSPLSSNIESAVVEVRGNVFGLAQYSIDSLNFKK